MSLRTRRLLPSVVVVLGAVGGLLLTALVLRGPSPTGQASPTQIAAPSDASEPSSAPSTPAASAPSVEPTAQPTVTSEPTDAPVAAGPAQLSWTAGTTRDGNVYAVIRFGERWIAGGSLGWPHGRAAVWTSTDGVAWSEPVLLDPELRSHVDCDHHLISGFAEWEGDLLAIGWNGRGCGDGGNPMLWRSGDGASWELVDLEGTAFMAEYPSPNSAVELADGRLAIFGATHLGSVRVLYLTADLETWEAHRISDGETGAYVERLAASPNLLIGVGSVVIGERQVETWTEAIYGPYVVTSTDGVTWTTVDPPSEEGTIAGIAWDGSNERFVAVGTDADGRPHAWLTADGTDWTSIQLGNEAAMVTGVVSSDGLTVASGAVAYDSPARATIVWSSFDGLSWWYGTVLNRRIGAVEAATEDAALLITGRTDGTGDTSWVGLVGTTAGDD